jgi:hypothetical protein
VVQPASVLLLLLLPAFVWLCAGVTSPVLLLSLLLLLILRAGT